MLLHLMETAIIHYIQKKTFLYFIFCFFQNCNEKYILVQLIMSVKRVQEMQKFLFTTCKQL